jgi:hypothetical protein
MSAVSEQKIQTTVQPLKPSTWRRNLKRLCLGSLALLLVVGTAAHLNFLYSGDSKWSLVSDRDGVKVYGMKVPGQTLKKFKAEFQVKASLNAITGFLQDYEAKTDVNFFGGKLLERENPQNFLTTWKSGFPAPFSDRDFVIRNIYTQDPVTKNISYTLQAVPDYLPPDACCVRSRRVDNNWLLSPQKDGVVAVRWSIDMEMGGMLPYFIANQAHPEMLAFLGTKMQSYVTRDKYAQAKAEWLVEP